MQKMQKSVFPGGIHPTDGFDKALSMNCAVMPYRPETVTILSEQSFGGKCSFLVKPGEHVTEGQLIGKPEAFMAAPLHASVSGKVLAVKEITEQGRRLMACILQREESPVSEAEASYKKGTADIGLISREEILTGIRDGGLTGMGGAGFPTHKKYETDKKITDLLINGAECEPFLTCDYRLMLEEGYSLLNGVRLLLKGSGAEKAYICMEDNKPLAAENLQKILTEMSASGLMSEGENLEIRVLPTKYPQGGERQLIQGVLGREVPMGGLPADVGVIVSNVGTAKAAADMIPTKYPQGGERQLIQGVLGREVPMGGLPADVGVIVSNVGTAKAAADMILGNTPLTKRIVTVTGSVKNPGNYLVPVGTSAKELIQLCGGVTTSENRKNRYCHRICKKSGELSGSCRNLGKRTDPALRRSNNVRKPHHCRRSYDWSLCCP